LAISIACSSVSYWDHAEHGPEDFLNGDGHVVADVGENGRLHIVAAVESVRTAEAAGDERRAFIDAGLDEALDLVPLRFGDDRADGPCRPGVLHLHFSMVALAMAFASSFLPRGTNMREGALQLWPVLVIICMTPEETALVMSASSRTMLAALAAELLRDALDRRRGSLRHQRRQRG